MAARSSVNGDVAVFFAELIGTMLLILLGDGVVANVLLKGSKGENGGWIVIAAGWGFAVAIAVYVVGWASGGHINPAVTLALALLGKTAWSSVPFYFAGQFLGAFLGALLVYASYYPLYRAEKDSQRLLLTFCTKPAVPTFFWSVVTEVIATAVLIVGICGIVNVHNDLSCGIAPYLFGILVFSIGLSLGGLTGYAINPARDLGPRVAHFVLSIPGKGSSEWGYSLVPLFAPFVGSALGVALYTLFLMAV